ncbi:hypothetical protein GE09DRAFT_951881 [Coniochaeta sp. 2T2.1]|nr:hypothetical protein GE09DRAFT_951881 [Coniochaeta sp. 2T2.1]
MATISQPRSIRAGGEQPPESLAQGSTSTWTNETIHELEAPPHIPVRKRPTPRHPIPSMQTAFAESLEEATKGPAVQKPKLGYGDAKVRREALLDQSRDDPPPAEAWRYRPGQQCHELRRLVAQISFGVYLLLEGMANNKVDVISILQSHIDEVDEFLETTLEDMALATKDLHDRLELLSLPVQNMEVFEKMLEDRAFRLQIVTGNEAIEHIVSRTTTALMQTAHDVAEGLKSTQEFTYYLADEEEGRWRYQRPDVDSIYKAMKGNAEGWYNAFLELQDKGNALNVLINKLNGVVAEMERKAGEVSRRTRFSIQPFTGPMEHSPRSSLRSSQSSASTITAADSPPSKISDAPPRLSLRLSSIIKPRTSTEPEEQPQPHTQPVEDREVEALPTLQAMTYQRPEPVSRRSPAVRHEPVIRRSSITLEERRSGLGVDSPHISLTPSPRVDSPTNDDDDEESVFILQPRTYTPQPPAPLPSPRVLDSPGVHDSPRLRDAAPKPTRQHSTPRAEEKEWQPQQPSHQSEERPEQPDAISPEPQPKQRTSLRQRVSLKHSPPQSILVPPPRSRDRQPSPAYHHSPQLYQGPDSAYASDVERQAVHSMVSMDSTLVDISPPNVFQRPALIPSPHSDQQFFRPVQASPHSPLQQRPHTSHTVRPRNPTYQQQHQRNVPSRMGLSMMSTETTMTTQNGKQVKKKRSAFGWLKKAFTMDEEERAEFEAKKNMQVQNPYYEARSPKFLDGKRIR